MPKGKSPRPPSTSTSTPRTEPMRPAAPPFQVTATFRASSAQLVTLFQNLPHLLEDIRVTRDGDVAERVGEVTFPRGTVIGDALAEAPPPAPKPPAAAPRPAKSNGTVRASRASGETFAGQVLTQRQKEKRDDFIKRFGPDVVLKLDEHSSNITIDAEANLKRIGKTRQEIMDNSFPTGTLESSIKKSFLLKGNKFARKST